MPIRRCDLLLDIDLPRVMHAFDAVDEHRLGSINEAQFIDLCRYANVQCNPLTFRRAAIATGNDCLPQQRVLEVVFASFTRNQVRAEREAIMKDRRAQAARQAAADAAASAVLSSSGPSTSATMAGKDDDGRHARDMRHMFNLCDSDGDGYVSYNDIRAVVKDVKQDMLIELVVRHSPEAETLRQSDAAKLRHHSLWDLLRRAKLPTDRLSTTKITPPLTVSNLISQWALLRTKVDALLSVDEMVRLAAVVQLLKRHGPVAVVKLPWPDDPLESPPEYTQAWELQRDTDGNARAPIDLASVRLNCAQFSRVFSVSLNREGWGTFAHDDPSTVPRRFRVQRYGERTDVAPRGRVGLRRQASRIDKFEDARASEHSSDNSTSSSEAEGSDSDPTDEGIRAASDTPDREGSAATSSSPVPPHTSVPAWRPSANLGVCGAPTYRTPRQHTASWRGARKEPDARKARPDQQARNAAHCSSAMQLRFRACAGWPCAPL